jgi:ribosomal protein S18 acetylase RimI-like enzyme
MKTLCRLLEWDSKFFGYRIGRVCCTRLTPGTVANILEWCGTEAIDCLYFLADPDDDETIKLAEVYRFHMVDIRITLKCSLLNRPKSSNSAASDYVLVRDVQPGDRTALQVIARSAYYDSRFYYDPHFSSESCAGLYETWIKQSCKGYADVVLVAETQGKPVGYVSCHLLGDDKGKIGLVGISESMRGCGVGKLMVNASLHWFAAHDVKVVEVVTQGRNYTAQRLYQLCGFVTESVHIWYHKWFSDPQLEAST